MTFTITSEMVEAFSLCRRKAFLLLRGEAERDPHEYASLIEEREKENRKTYCNRLLQTDNAAVYYGPFDPLGSCGILVNVLLTADGLEAHCDAIRKVKRNSTQEVSSYEALKVVGTPHIEKSQIIGLAYLGYVLGKLQNYSPIAGTIVRTDGKASRITLTEKYKQVKSIVAVLKAWTEDPRVEAPPVFLNKHCPACLFRNPCRRQAEKEDNLSLLNGMSPRLMQKYHAKGIFTVNQLSYLFRSRRTKKKGQRPVRHNLELQALALRTEKTYIEHFPDLSRRKIELFVDIESIPDQASYYLIGLLVCVDGETQYHAFWANSVMEEGQIWKTFVDRVATFPDAPLYHYGSYERKACKSLARRYDKGRELAKRLINVTSCIYGKVYFPVRSNGLKVLGKYLGARWTAPEPSGLQSIVWRHRWEMTGAECYKQALLQYNREDCEALHRLTETLSNIKEKAGSESTIDFVNRPKQYATEIGLVIHREFKKIRKSAELGSSKKNDHTPLKDVERPDGPKKTGGQKGRQSFRRIAPTKAGRTVRVLSKRRCPLHHLQLVSDPKKLASRMVIDLIFTKNGCRKTTTKYVGEKAYCPKCIHPYNPPSFQRHRGSFGHEFQAWAIYQRIVLRLPYRIVTEVMQHLFGVGLSVGTVVSFLGYLAVYYKATEVAILQGMLKSDFIHVDETKINIQGIDHYVWVFTDGRHVLFRMTETREADIVREVLSGYEGVLVSDFYPGYDSMTCRQQKCLVHLIRDLDNDLWKAPFDGEFEALIVEIRELLLPILKTIDKYGLKAYHLRKFAKSVERFYFKNIDGQEYTSDYAAKYQKRFQRYRAGLFMFLEQDGIPWNNNMAERAIRQLAIQRKISGTFFKKCSTSISSSASHRADLSFPGEVVPEVLVVERTGCR